MLKRDGVGGQRAVRAVGVEEVLEVAVATEV